MRFFCTAPHPQICVISGIEKGNKSMNTFRLANRTMILLSAIATALFMAFAPGPFSLSGTALAQELPTDNPPVNFRVTSYGHDVVYVAWEIPRDRGITGYVLQRYEPNGSASPYARWEDSTNGGAGHGQGDGTVQPDTQYSFVLKLQDDSKTTIIEVSVSVRTLPTPTDPPPPTLSNDATLSSLTLSGIDIGTFDSATTSYSAQVANNVTETTVTAAVNHSGASYVIKLGGVADADGVIPLAVGSNAIAIEVTAQDGTTTRIYSASVTRDNLSTPPPPARSNDAALSALTLSGINFGTFASATTSYSAQVANAVAQTTVTPTVNHSGASYVIKLDGVADADGVIPLAVGSNTIAIEVTAEDGSTSQTYTVIVTRDALPTPNELPTDDPPVNFRVTSYGHDWISVAWGVPRGRGITGYVLQRYEPDGSASPSARWEDSTNGGAGHGWSQINAEPDTQYRFVLKLQDDSKTTIIEASVSVRTSPTPGSAPSDPRTDATLSALTLSGIDIGTFDSATTSYSAQVANAVAQTTVTPTLNHSGASYVIKLGGVIDTDGVIPLAVGSNTITIEVTAQDSVTTRIYTVSVTRGDTPRSPNFRVSSATHNLVYVAWEIPRGRGITGYVLQRYEPDGSASPSARWEGSTNGGASHGQGDGTVQPDTQYRYVLMLKDDSGATLIEASVSVRTPPTPGSVPSDPRTDATLSSLSVDIWVSRVDFDRSFSPDWLDYKASVAKDVPEINVTATVNHSGASYVIKLGGVIDTDGVIPLAVGSNAITIEVTAQDSVTTRIYTVTVTRASSTDTGDTLSADFNGDGVLDVADFLLFVDVYGKRSGDAGFDARMDLDDSGEIGVGDFLIFVSLFSEASAGN